MVRFGLGPLLQGQTRIAKPKSAYNLLTIGPRGLQCQTTLQKIRLDLGSLLHGQTRIAKLKSAYNSFIIGPRGLQCEPSYRKSCLRNLLILSDMTLGLSSRSNEDSQRQKLSQLAYYWS